MSASLKIDRGVHPVFFVIANNGKRSVESHCGEQLIPKFRESNPFFEID